MRLAALIILDHFLIETPTILNFGGPFTYQFKLNKSKIELIRSEQTQYIPNFFGERITNLSAIVGANGSGKTSIIRVLNKWNDETRAIFIYENEQFEIKIVNRTGHINENGDFTEKSQLKVLFDKKELTGIVVIDIPSLYYSPIADFDLANIESPISQTKHFKLGLEDFHLDNVERNILFMSDDIIKELKNIFPELPSYDKLIIRPKPLYKRDLRKLYGGFRVKGEIEKAHEKVLDELWESYGVLIKKKEHLLHNSMDFFRDFEINIFSYLLVDGTFMRHSFNGKYELSFKEILSKGSFDEKLTHRFFSKIAFIDKYVYQRFKKEFKGSYKELLFLFETTNFDEELRKKEKISLNIIDQFKTDLVSHNHEQKVEAFFKMIDQLKKELQGKEFENINNNLIKFVGNLTSLDPKNHAEVGKIINKIVEGISNGIPKSFENIFQERLEIIDQIKDAAKRNIRLFDGIQKLYLILQDSQTKSGAKVTEGKLSLDLTQIDFKYFNEIIKHYRNVLSEFHSNSVIGRVQLLEFYPNKRLSFGEKSLLSFFSSLFEFTLNKHYHDRRKKNYLLLLDETDLGYHPLWKRKFISALVRVIPVLFSRLEFDSKEEDKKMEVKENPNVQIIVSTHDPLTLSDIPNSHITYLNKIGDKSIVLNQQEKPKHSFGANITDLLADSFFVEDGLIGDFSKAKIDEVLMWLNYKILQVEINNLQESSKEDVEDKNIERLIALKKDELDTFGAIVKDLTPEYCQSLINIVDEPLLRNSLQEMYTMVYTDNTSLDMIKDYARRLGRDDVADIL